MKRVEKTFRIATEYGTEAYQTVLAVDLEDTNNCVEIEGKLLGMEAKNITLLEAVSNGVFTDNSELFKSYQRGTKVVLTDVRKMLKELKETDEAMHLLYEHRCSEVETAWKKLNAYYKLVAESTKSK